MSHLWCKNQERSLRRWMPMHIRQNLDGRIKAGDMSLRPVPSGIVKRGQCVVAIMQPHSRGKIVRLFESSVCNASCIASLCSKAKATAYLVYSAEPDRGRPIVKAITKYGTDSETLFPLGSKDSIGSLDLVQIGEHCLVTVRT